MSGGERMETAGRGLRLAAHAAGAVLPSHVHRAPRFCLVLRGEFDEVLRGERSRPGEGALLYRPALAEHEEVFGPHGAIYGVLDVGPAFLDAAERCGFDPESASSATHPAPARAEAVLRRELAGWDEFSALSCEALSLEWLALMARAGRRGADEPAAGLAARVMDLLRARRGDVPGLAAIAASVDAHPSHVARAFRRAYGESVGAMGRRLRIEHGAELLRATTTPLAEIAVECGFSSQAHFTTVFRHAHGLTPGRYRRLLR